MDLQKFKDAISIAATGQTAAQGQAKGLCINCHEPALPKCYSEEGRREYAISGMCEKCFDAVCGDEEEPDVEINELTELQYASTGEGPWRLYIFGEDGYHSGTQWFCNGTPKYPDEEITSPEAKTRAQEAIAKGLEVRITDGGDQLVFHSQNGVILYPELGREFWKEVGC